MPKEISQREFEAVYQAVKRFPDGAAVEEIGRKLAGKLPRRTLQRRLARLVEQHRLVSEGAGRGCRYRLPAKTRPVKTSVRKAAQKQEVLSVLARLKPELATRFGVTRLALFGSTVHDQARPESDIDIVVAFAGPATSQRYFGVQFLLEDELGHPVDLVTEKAMRPELRPHIEGEAINV